MRFLSSSNSRSLTLIKVVLAWLLRGLKRLWAYHLDLLSASYYSGMLDYKDCDPNYQDEDPERNGEFSVVVKTRGGQQYYQSDETMAWELTWDDICGKGKIPKYNPTDRLSELEAEGRNRALSIQRKTYLGGAFIFIGIILEALFNLDISLLT